MSAAPVPAPSRTTTHRECALFSSGPARGEAPAAGAVTAASPVRTPLPPRVSARAAFQEVLHGRAVLVDVRPAARRAAQGDVAAALRPLSLEADLEQAAPALVGERVVVLGHDGTDFPAAAELLARLGARRVTEVVGGFHAWREAGLPTS